MVGEAVTAAERLAAEGIEAEVIDPRTLVPLDLETIVDSVARTGRAVIAHEAVQTRRLRRRDRGRSFRRAAFDYLDAPIAAGGRAVHAGPVQPSARGRLPARGPTRSCARRPHRG